MFINVPFLKLNSLKVLFPFNNTMGFSQLKKHSFIFSVLIPKLNAVFNPFTKSLAVIYRGTSTSYFLLSLFIFKITITLSSFPKAPPFKLSYKLTF